MIDLESRLRDHLTHEAERINVPEGSPPVPLRRSPWSSVVVVPLAATFALVALIGALILFERSEPLTEAVDNATAATQLTTPAETGATAPVTTMHAIPDSGDTTGSAESAESQVELVAEIPGQARAFAPDHPVMISAVPDLRRPGCEGFPAETWQQVDLTDGSTTPVDDGRVTGMAISFGEEVVIADRCEGFLDSIRVGRFTDKGTFVIDDTTVAVDESLQQAALTPDRASGELVAVTEESIRRLDLATGEWVRSVASPFTVMPSSVSVIGEVLVGAVYRERPNVTTHEGDDRLLVEIYRENGESVDSLSNCSMVVSDISEEEAIASGACGIYIVDGTGEARLFSDKEVLVAQPLPNSENVLALPIADVENGAMAEWEIITPEGDRYPVPDSTQSPGVVVSDDGNLLAVPSADPETTRIVTTEGIIA